MFHKYILPVFALLYVVTVSSATAQFEGKIVFTSYEVNADGLREQDDQFTMYVTRQRILLKGEKNYEVIGSIKTEGILIRFDFEDFVFLTADNTALNISKADIISMMTMFGNGGSNSDSEDRINYQKTGEEKTIQGYQCEKFIFTDKEDPDDQVVAWMSQDLQVNWGMLSEPWGNSEFKMLSDDFPVDVIFRDGYFPVLIEAYESGELKEVTEAEQISESTVAKAMVQIPPGVKVLSFQDYLFSKMSDQ